MHDTVSYSLRARRSGHRIPVGKKFSVPVQNGPGTHPASYAMGAGCLSLGWRGRGVALTIHLPYSAEVKERVELYLCCPSGISWPVQGRTLPLPFHWQCSLRKTLEQFLKRRVSKSVRNWRAVVHVWSTVLRFTGWLVFKRLRKISKSDSYVRHVRLSIWSSVRMEHLGSHWTDFDEIWYLGFYSKFCQENSSFIEIRQK